MTWEITSPAEKARVTDKFWTALLQISAEEARNQRGSAAQ